jgi:hypothetical protein
MATNKVEFQAKIKRLEAIRIKVEEFVAKGGDLKSQEAVPLGIELIHAFNEVSTEFGHPVLKNIKDNPLEVSPEPLPSKF